MVSLFNIHSLKVRVAMRYLGVLCLGLALIAPKVSLALSSVLGGGYQSVVICNGSGLVRVTVSPTGQIIDDVTTEWASSHCVPAGDHTEHLHRRWQAVSFDDSAPTYVSHVQAVPHWMESRLTPITGRGPPAA